MRRTKKSFKPNQQEKRMFWRLLAYYHIFVHCELVLSLGLNMSVSPLSRALVITLDRYASIQMLRRQN